MHNFSVCLLRHGFDTCQLLFLVQKWALEPYALVNRFACICCVFHVWNRMVKSSLDANACRNMWMCIPPTWYVPCACEYIGISFGHIYTLMSTHDNYFYVKTFVNLFRCHTSYPIRFFFKYVLVGNRKALQESRLNDRIRLQRALLACVYLKFSDQVIRFNCLKQGHFVFGRCRVLLH